MIKHIYIMYKMYIISVHIISYQFISYHIILYYIILYYTYQSTEYVHVLYMILNLNVYSQTLKNTEEWRLLHPLQ